MEIYEESSVFKNGGNIEKLVRIIRIHMIQINKKILRRWKYEKFYEISRGKSRSKRSIRK